MGDREPPGSEEACPLLKPFKKTRRTRRSSSRRRSHMPPDIQGVRLASPVCPAGDGYRAQPSRWPEGRHWSGLILARRSELPQAKGLTFKDPLRRNSQGLGHVGGGLWEVRSTSLPFLHVPYLRYQLMGCMTPAMAPKSHTLRHAMDFMLQLSGGDFRCVLPTSQGPGQDEGGADDIRWHNNRISCLLESTSIPVTAEFREAAQLA